MPLDGAKVLRCINKLGGTVIISLNDIYAQKDDINDIVFEETLEKSLKTKGMLNPILVCTDTDYKQTDLEKFERRNVPEDIVQTYRCLIGNNRYKFAVDNGYTHIECFLVKTFAEVKKAHLQTQIEPRKM